MVLAFDLIDAKMEARYPLPTDRQRAATCVYYQRVGKTGKSQLTSQDFDVRTRISFPPSRRIVTTFKSNPSLRRLLVDIAASFEAEVVALSHISYKIDATLQTPPPLGSHVEPTDEEPSFYHAERFTSA
ncbi:hypothetical protein TWF694_000205 [Orbilia ellipsospora]|uniref:Uncharacterized protein n=1 Tax=Orbilia ellipsospora TaxID=2528407 RepID=A0AAV9XMW6_9PEZI